MTIMLYGAERAVHFRDPITGERLCWKADHFEGHTITEDESAVSCKTCLLAMHGLKLTAENREWLKLRGAPRVPAAKNGLCPRCSTRLTSRYDEVTCLTCGYVDYGE